MATTTTTKKVPKDFWTKPRHLWKKHRRYGGGDILNLHELSLALGESERTIEYWRSIGVIPFLRVGHRTVRFDLSRVKAALMRREVRAR
jgi:hypothetical protein